MKGSGQAQRLTSSLTYVPTTLKYQCLLFIRRNQVSGTIPKEVNDLGIAGDGVNPAGQRYLSKRIIISWAPPVFTKLRNNVKTRLYVISEAFCEDHDAARVSDGV